MENVTFEIAKKLKELNYTEFFCEKYYYTGDELLYEFPAPVNYYKNEPDKIILAPTWFKAINWLRETHGVHMYTEWSNDDKFTLVLQGDIFKSVEENDIYHNTIEEAYESGFNEAFEIIEKKKKEDQEYIMGMIDKYKPEIDKIFEERKERLEKERLEKECFEKDDLISRKDLLNSLLKAKHDTFDSLEGLDKAICLVDKQESVKKV